MYIFVFWTRIGHPVTMTTLSGEIWAQQSSTWAPTAGIVQSSDALFSEFSTDLEMFGVYLDLCLHLLHLDSHPVTVTITLKNITDTIMEFPVIWWILLVFMLSIQAFCDNHVRVLTKTIQSDKCGAIAILEGGWPARAVQLGQFGTLTQVRLAFDSRVETWTC